MKKRQNSINLSGIDAKRNSEGLLICLNCDKKLPKRRQKYCSYECSYEWASKHSQGLMRSRLIKRFKGVCNHCKKQMVKMNYKKDYSNLSIQEFIELYTTFESSIDINNERAITIDDSQLILDHISPIALGGEEFNESNLQILCLDCNKIKTQKDFAEIAKARRVEKIMYNGQKPLVVNKNEESKKDGKNN